MDFLFQKAGIKEQIYKGIINSMLSKTELVEKLAFSSFLDESTQRSYFQSYQARLKKLLK